MLERRRSNFRFSFSIFFLCFFICCEDETGSWTSKGMLRMAASLATSFIVVIVFFFAVVDSSNNSEIKCSKVCVAENCNSVGIRYGKFCGVGWTGCPGEKPCDDLDACCKIHDDCVEKKGLINIKCHEKFKTCMKKVQKSGKVGFSRECPFERAVATMEQGMNLAILFSQFGSSKLEL